MTRRARIAPPPPFHWLRLHAPGVSFHPGPLFVCICALWPLKHFSSVLCAPPPNPHTHTHQSSPFCSNAGKFTKMGAVVLDVVVLTGPRAVATGPGPVEEVQYISITVTNARAGTVIGDTEALFVPFKSQADGKGPSSATGRMVGWLAVGLSVRTVCIVC